MSSKNGPVLIPKTKISMTILEFGEPLFAQFPECPPIDVLRSALGIVITVWNAHTLAMPIWGEPHHLDNVKKQLSGPDVPPWTDEVVAALTQRRRERFKDDPRAVGEWTIRPAPDGIVFRCDARLPARFVGDGSKRTRGRSRRAGPDDSAKAVGISGPGEPGDSGGPG